MVRKLDKISVEFPLKLWISAKFSCIFLIKSLRRFFILQVHISLSSCYTDCTVKQNMDVFYQRKIWKLKTSFVNHYDGSLWENGQVMRDIEFVDKCPLLINNLIISLLSSRALFNISIFFVVYYSDFHWFLNAKRWWCWCRFMDIDGKRLNLLRSMFGFCLMYVFWIKKFWFTKWSHSTLFLTCESLQFHPLKCHNKYSSDSTINFRNLFCHDIIQQIVSLTWLKCKIFSLY